jgi:hypothetical protein
MGYWIYFENVIPNIPVVIPNIPVVIGVSLRSLTSERM